MKNLIKTFSPIAKNLKPVMAFFLTFLTIMSITPMNVLAAAANEHDSQAIAQVQAEPISPQFIYWDGERIYLDDERIINVVQVEPSITPFAGGIEGMASGNAPNVTQLVSISGEFSQAPNVFMGPTLISAIRYAVEIDGVLYEAFCADPALPGPESQGAVYALSGPVAATFNTVLKYGFPTNPYMSQFGPVAANADEMMRLVYVTRVAVAIAGNPTRQFTGDMDTIQYAQKLVDGHPFWVRDYDTTKPAIMVNGNVDAADLNNIVDSSVATAQSEAFVLSYNRRTQGLNHFRFEWAAGTPAGAELVVNGNVTATAPSNSSEIFWGDVSFHIRMPNIPANHNQVAKVYMLGVHNQFANNVWLMQNAVNQQNWQDIVFFIPYMRASAAFSFMSEDESEGGLRIVKQNPSGQGLAGAVFQISGPDGFTQTVTTPANGEVLLLGLAPGVYTITEVSPPPGHMLASPATVTVTIAPNSTEIIEKVFVNQPYTNGEPPETPEPVQLSTVVQITKINELTTELVPGASVRLRGISNQTIILPDGSSWQLDNTGIDVTVVLTEGHALPPLPPNPEDGPVMNPVTHELQDGVWTLFNLPFGAYIVYEVTPPHNFSILPAQNHGGAYAFWLAPPNLSVSQSDVEDGEDDEPQVMINWDDFAQLLMELAGIDIGEEPDLGDLLGILGEILNNLELQVILPDSMLNPSYEIGFDPVVSSIQVQFRNYPYGSIQVSKFSTATGQGLAGAHFRLQGYAVGAGQHSSYPIQRDGMTGADGTLVFDNLPAGHFTITEIQPPPGYILGRANDPHSVTQGVNVTWGNETTVSFFNDPEGYLIITKVDGVTGQMLSGAVFEVSGLSGTQQGITGGGTVTFSGLTPGHQYVVTEISPPPGFVLMEGSRSIAIQPGTNTMVWENWRNPTLTIIKVDQDTNQRLAGAHFTVTFEDGSIPNNLPELITNSNGEIVIDGVLLDWDAERTLIVTEVVPPPGYHLGTVNWQTVTLRAGYNQTVVFSNRRRPTITITKLDAVLGTPIANAVFHIEKLDNPERGPLTGNPFRTNANGQIVLPIRHAGRYLIREIQAAPNYWLDPQQSNREWIIDVLPNEDYYLTIENTLLPTLVITKMNMINMRPVPLTWFRVYYEVPLSNNVRFVTEQMTNSRGQIILPFVDVGWYRVIETRPAPGMSLNVNNSYRIFLEPGRNSYTLLQQGLLPSQFNYLLPNADNVPGGSNNPGGSNPQNPQSPPYEGNANAPNDDLDIPAREVEQLPPSDNPLPDDIANLPMTGFEPAVADITGNMQWSDGSNFQDPNGQVWNWPLNSIIIRKICNVTGQLLPNATFDLIHISQGQTGTQGQVVGTFTTNHTGIIVITGLLPGSYAVEEVTAPPNFTLSGQTRQLAWLAPDNHSIVELTFANEPFGSLLVSLRCEVTGTPLQNGEFRVTNSAGQVVGTANGLHRTNQQGEFLIPNVAPDTYIVTQILAPNGYTFGSVQVHQTILVPATGQTYRLEFTNQPYSALIIRKLDSFDSSPIPGAVFRVNRPNGELIGEFITDQMGTVEITGLLGHFTVTELHVPAGFERDTTTVRTTYVMPQAPSIVTFFSPRLGSLTIEAVDGFGAPIAGAGFRVSRQNGELVGTFTTPASGIVNLPTLTSGWYVVEPTTPPTGFITADTGRSVDVQPNSAPRTTFVYHRLSVLTIEAVDGDTGAALAGVQFEVRRPNGERISTGTTNNAGVFVVNGIDPRQGAVIVEPLSAPTGFVINEQARTVEFALGQNRTERFRAYRMGSLVIELTSENGNPLQGGRFRVTRPNGVVLGEFTTPASGLITINNLESGAYIVEQVSPPTNWVMTDTGRTVEVHATQTTRVQFTNTQRPSIVIEKVDENGAPLAGAEFEVRTLAGALIQRVVTNNGGVATIPNLEPGVFVIEETRPPQGFVITEGARTVELIAGQTLTERFVNHRATTLTIEKVDDAGSPLAGAEFEIRTLSGELLHRVTTNNGGIITIPNMQPGTIVIEETRAPQGFVLDGVARIVEIMAGQNRTERFVNHRTPSLIIEKVDENGAPLQGAEFEVRTLTGALIQRVVTNSGGIATITNLEPGVYIIEETRPPQGFVITESARTIEFVAGQSHTERFVNLRAATLTIEKMDDNGNPLAGAEFEIRTLSGELLHRAVTNNGGIITIPNMSPGTVVIQETRAPQGFVLDSMARTVELSAGQNRTERFVNHRSPNLIIEKVDENGAPLQGAEFEIRTLTGALIQRVVTNSGGIATITNLEPGVYIIEETRPPQGFVITESARTIEFAAGQSHTERFVNLRAATLTIEKVDEDGNPLAGAEFEIRTLSGELLHRAVTNNGGVITLPNMSPGTVVIQETRAPQGFVLDSMARSVELSAGQNRTERFVNHRSPSLIIEKVDENGAPLQGAEFEIRTLTGALIQRVVTNSGGIATITNLEPGVYIIEETRPPQGFVITESARTIEFVAGQSLTERFVNLRAATLTIEKVDSDGQPLGGAEFEIRTPSGELLHRAVTNNGGIITIPNMQPGTVVIEETRAPVGFVVTETGRTVEMAAGLNRTERFVNHRAPSLIIEKVDENGLPLGGAEFEIRRFNGELVHRVVSNNAGLITIEHLEPGAYQVIETRPPAGHTIIEPSRAIQIVAGETRVERFVNPRLATFIIQKVDGVTNAPLQGVIFEITTLAGEHVRNPANNSFEFVTDSSGMIRLPELPAGSYVATETRALPGYRLAQPHVFQVGHDRDYIITIRNFRYPDYNIRKIDGHTNEPLAGVTFEIAHFFGGVEERLRNPRDGSFIWTTDGAGLIRIPHLPHGTYVAREIRPLPGFQVADPVIFVVNDFEPTTLTIHNYRYSVWNILKLDGTNNQPQQGVVFEVARLYGTGHTGDRLRNPNTGSFDFITGTNGMVTIGSLEPGTWIITETRPLPGFIAAEPQIITVSGNTVDTTITFRNYPMGDINLRKIDGDTDQPLQGVVFEIHRQNGERVLNPHNSSFEFVTDNAGRINLGFLAPGAYIAVETRALQGYQLADPTPFEVIQGRDLTVTVRNFRMGDINLRKIDGNTNQPLQGVIFEIHRINGERVQNPANNTFEFVTDSTGRINLGFLAPGSYFAVEIQALPGYQLAGPAPFEVVRGRDLTVTVRNYRMDDISILKIDGDTDRPLQGVMFEIQRQNGERVQNPVTNTFEFVTDSMGRINLGFLAPGTYIAVETRALPGYQLADPTTFEVIQGRDLTVTIRNYRQADLTILKVNSITRQPLAGVHFQINRPDGTLLRNPRTGTNDFITDWRGIIYLPAIEDGVIYIRETRALPGFLVDNELTRVIINAEARSRQHLVTIENTPAAGLLIIATHETTGEPLQGIEFEIRRADGRLVTGQMLDGNQRDTHANSPQLSGNGLFVTDASGRINLNHLEPGIYHVSVVSSLDGFQADNRVYTVTVHPGQQAVLEVRLAPLAGFRLLAVDAITGRGIFNAEFMVFDGNNQVVGAFRTDNNGLIDFSHILNPGRYTIRVTSVPRGYSGDEIPRTVEFIAGRITEITWEFMPQAGQIQIQVLSADDNFHNALPAGIPLEGAIFEVFEARTGNIVDRFISGSNGMAVSSPLPLGRYIIRQVQAPAFYQINPNEMHVEIEFETQIIRITYPNFSANMAVTIRVTGPQQVTQGQPVVYEIMAMMNESTVPLADFYWRATLPVEAVRADRLITGTYNQNLRYRVLGTTNTGREIVIADNLSTTRNNVIELAPVHLGLGANEFLVDFILHFGQVPAGFMAIENPRIFANVLPTSATVLPPNMMFAILVDVGGRVVGSNEWVLGNNTSAATLWNNNQRIPQSGW